MTLYFNNSMSFYLQHTLKSTHINLDTSGKLANLRRDLRHINTFCSALEAGVHEYFSFSFKAIVRGIKGIRNQIQAAITDLRSSSQHPSVPDLTSNQLPPVPDLTSSNQHPPAPVPVADLLHFEEFGEDKKKALQEKAKKTPDQMT